LNTIDLRVKKKAVVGFTNKIERVFFLANAHKLKRKESWFFFKKENFDGEQVLINIVK